MNYVAYMTYDYAKFTDVTVTDDTYEQVGILTTPTRPDGVYEMKLSMAHTLDSTSTAAYFRYSVDGGTTWIEMIREAKNKTDICVDTYIEPISHTNGVMSIIVQARKEVATDVLVIKNLNIIFDRKA